MLKKIIHKLNLQGDKHIWLVVFIFFLISILAVYSASGSLAFKRNIMAETFLLKQFFTFFSGLVIMYFAHLINYKAFSRISQLLLFIAIPLLIYTLFFGTEINGARRWISLPAGLSFQSSDLAKLALFMFLARELAKRQSVLEDFYQGFLPLILPVSIVCLLIFPANFSTSALLFFTCLIIMFLGRVPIKFLLLTIITIITAGGILGIVILKVPEVQKFGRLKTMKTRIETFLGNGDKEDNYQILQSKIAIAKGGIFGKMPGNSTQRNLLPEAYSDYIFAIICEEYGFIGAFIVLSLYLYLLYRVIKIVLRSPNTYNALLALGLGVSIVLQALINMSVATNLLPSTGLTLPFISLGGSSIWFLSLALGIILSVSRENYMQTDILYINEIKEDADDLGVIFENEASNKNNKIKQSDTFGYE
jgi:cell division protein FtsW